MHTLPSHPQDDDPPGVLPAEARDLFAQALELEPEAREALLDEAHRRDPETAAEIRSLVEAWFLEPAFLDQSRLDQSHLDPGRLDPGPPDANTPDQNSALTDNSESLAAPQSACSPLDLQQLLRHWSRYRLDRRLGHGSTSLVYRATDRVSGARVAIKFLVHLGETELARFEHEATTLRKIEHEAVLPLLDSGTVDGVPFLVTRLVDGPGLLDLRSQTSLEEKVEIFLRVAQGLDAAHQLRVVHRDIKPSNILLEPTEEGWRPYLADFGIARDPESRGLTATGMLVGTPAYLAPERLRGSAQPLDPRSDLYSLGVTFYEFLAGQRPYATDDTLEILNHIRHGALRRPRQARPDLPEALETLLLNCLAYSPETRYPSTRALITDLERFLAGQAVTPRRQRPLNRRPVIALGALAGTAVVAVALGGFGMLDGLVGPRPEPSSSPPAVEPQFPAVGAVPSPTATTLDLHHQGRQQLRLLHFAKAKAFFETALETNDDQPLLHADLARAWLGLGFDVEAQRHAERAVALASGSPETIQHSLHSLLHRTHDRWEESTQLLIQAWERTPGDLEIGLQLAEAWIGSGTGEPVLEILRQLEQSPEHSTDPRLALTEARAALALGDLDLAARAIEQARRGAESIAAPLIVARARLVETTIQSRRRAPEAALDAATEAKTLFVQAGDTAGAADALLLIARLLADQGSPQEALQANREAMVFYREVGHQSGRASALNQIAITGYSVDQDLATAQRHFEESLALYRTLGHRPGIANTLGNLALLMGLNERFDQASTYYQQALEQYRALGQQTGIARTLLNLALTLQNQGQTGEAIVALEESLEIRDTVGDRRGLALTHLNLGHLHRLRGNLRGAHDHYRSSLATSQELEWAAGRGRALQGLGRVAYLRSEPEAAQQLLEDSLVQHEASGAPANDAYSRIILAQLWLDQGRPQRAVETLPSAPSGNAAAWTHALLARAHGALGSLPTSLEHLEAARELRQQGQGFSDLEVDLELSLAEHALGAPRGSVAWREAVEAPLEAALQQALEGELVTVACAARLALAITGSGPAADDPRPALEAVAEIAERNGLHLYRDKALQALEPRERR